MYIGTMKMWIMQNKEVKSQKHIYTLNLGCYLMLRYSANVAEDNKECVRMVWMNNVEKNHLKK